MGRIPSPVRGVFQGWSREFAPSVWPRFLVLTYAALMCTGRRSISRLLRVAGHMAEGHWSTYHKVFCRRRWSLWRLARPLAEHILTHLVPHGVVVLAGDDTVTEHRGKQVFGKGCHRDAVHSSHNFVAYRWGHKWVVLSILVTLPGMSHPWALPILCALYRTNEENERRGRCHKTPVDLMRQLLCVLLRWFPQRKFVFVGDGGFGTHALAGFAHHHRQRLTLVSRFYPDANLYAPPPPRPKGQTGRPRKKGAKLPAPQQVVEQTQRRTRLVVSWYGGGRRHVEIVTGTGHWYRMGAGLVPVRWVYVHDRTGTHRDEYFFTTDLSLSAAQIIEFYTGRWAIEVTFEECRAHVGFGTTRGWCERTILRAEPCLLGLYTLVAVWSAHRVPRAPLIVWRGKRTIAFSDAITFVRRQLWHDWIFESPRHGTVFQKLTPKEKHLMLSALTHAL